MLWPLSWDDDNWRRIIYTLGLNYHATSVVMRPWQLTDHVSFMNDILPYSDRCHETMPTEGASFILEWYITMLWPLSWDEDKWQSMIHTLEIYNHALTVVLRLWQQTGHVSWMNDILPCSDCCHERMTSDGASFTEGDITMFWTLSWDDDKWRSIIYNLEIYYHDLTAAMRRWQLTEHASYLRDE